MTLAFALFSFCAGIAIYFALPFEPAIAYPFLISLLCAVNLFIWRKHNLAPIIFAFLFGFFYATAHTRFIDIPYISNPKRDIEISGSIKNIDYMPDKIRAFIKTNETEKLPSMLVRVSLPLDATTPNIGDEITANGTLFPPSPADAPGGFDSAEWTYFDGLSATGYLTKITVTKENTANNIATLRNELHKKLDSKLFDSLVLGYKNSLTFEENNAWKAAGIMHVFSISGFHITLVGGWLFAMFYFFFRSMPPITRRIPARYPAMVFAWFGLLFYLFISGAEVATQRAFLTTSLMFLAFIAGRTMFTMRNAALVFAGLLLTNPHYLVEPGFQLSFSAIFGMIWFFGGSEYKKLSFWKKIWRALHAMIMTTIIASIFTAPFIAYHFNNVQIYSLIGNLICLPIFSLLIMPLTMIGMTTWAENIYNFTLKIAEWISTFPYAFLQTPNMPGIALALFTAALLCLMLVKNKKIKIIAIASCVLLSVIIIVAKPRPIFYTTADHELIAIVQDGKLYFNRNKASNHYFAFDTWKISNFEPTGTTNLRIKCEKGLCIIKTENWSLAYTQKFMPLLNHMEELCTENDFIASYLNITNASNCKAEILSKGFVIYKNGRVEYVIANRYWHIRPKQNKALTMAQ
ncbi:MAG: ComEC family competence protein [Alphaproteobacteria bacterium]|nr:ComEC family competence protein [Alphaproteobacteria bacterium]